MAKIFRTVIKWLPALKQSAPAAAAEAPAVSGVPDITGSPETSRYPDITDWTLGARARVIVITPFLLIKIIESSGSFQEPAPAAPEAPPAETNSSSAATENSDTTSFGLLRNLVYRSVFLINPEII